MRQTLFTILVFSLAAPLCAQSKPTGPDLPPVAKTVNLSGPRFGVTMLSDGIVQKLDERGIHVEPAISQFGWQFEHRFFERPGGFCGLNEFVLLLGGLDQAHLVPTASWILGVRSQGGFEVGAGPVLSIAEMVKSLDEGTFGVGANPAGKTRSFAGVGFAAAAGVTLRSGGVNFPFNLVMVRSMERYRLSLLVGFTLEDIGEG